VSLTATKRYANRSLLHCAKGQSCVLCGVQDGTIVPAHLPGSIYGMPAGIAQKAPDWLVAHLCHGCHEKMDTIWRKDCQMRMKALCLTLERLFEQRIITYGAKTD